MSESKRQLLSIGVFLLIIVAVIVLYAATPFVRLEYVMPLILVLSGIWVLVLAAIRSQNPQKYERGPFSTLNMGLLMIAVGGAWYLLYLNWLYSLALLLLVLGSVAIVAALKRK
jgi:hypothetical protein